MELMSRGDGLYWMKVADLVVGWPWTWLVLLSGGSKVKQIAGVDAGSYTTAGLEGRCDKMYQMIHAKE
jgi:hypothetical protein